MAIININANLNGGDVETPDNELFYRIYGDVDAYASPIHTTGTAIADADVTVTGDVVDISNVDGTTNTSFKIAAVDGAGNEGILSDAKAGGYIIDSFPAFAGFSFRKIGTDNGDNTCGMTLQPSQAIDNVLLDDTESVTLDSLLVGEAPLNLGEWMGSSDATLRAIYDQSTTVNAQHLKQLTSADQPKMSTAGVLTTTNGLTAIDSDNKALRPDNPMVLSTASHFWVFAVVEIDGGAAQQTILSSTGYTAGGGGVNGGFEFVKLATGEIQFGQRASATPTFSIFTTSSAPSVGQKLITLQFTPNTTNALGINMWINGVAQTNSQTGQDSTVVLSDEVVNVLGRYDDSNMWAGKLQELILFNDDQSANRTTIESNINAFYSIY